MKKLPSTRLQLPQLGEHIPFRVVHFKHLAKLANTAVLATTHPVVVGGSRVLVTRNHLRGHPVRCANEGVTLANGPVQLG